MKGNDTWNELASQAPNRASMSEREYAIKKDKFYESTRHLAIKLHYEREKKPST